MPHTPGHEEGVGWREWERIRADGGGAAADGTIQTGGDGGGGGGGGGGTGSEAGDAIIREGEAFLGIDRQRAREQIAAWLAANPGKTEADYWTWRRDQDQRSSEDRARGYEAMMTDEGPLGGLTQERLWGYKQAMIDQLGDRTPTLKDLSVIYGKEDPDLYLPDASEYDALDPRTRVSQMQALRAMEEVYGTGGMTPADAARMQAAQQETGGWLAAQQAANMAQSQARGLGGSGLELAGGLASTQQAAQSLGARDLSMQVQAQNRALQAMQQAGGLAGETRGQDMRRASALDDFNMGVARSRRDVAERNVDRGNESLESRAQAHRDIYGYREGATAMRTGQYAGATTAEQRAESARERRESMLTGVVSGFGDAIAGLAGLGDGDDDDDDKDGY